ncbi:sulfite exporter TauE/SafE family protein [Sporolactobacillus putidus]|uniref:Probable membrane transporter protein n=1 Tax=Sporolactobacillus putidus TaxID=492735 RepID=A0A917W0H5_9BACL|nr:sulfite exporter TauE/SafE family protein [Sporolactobacillus putidus]GGL46486.1 UPF0721 transmembrane protein YdhB [Sporolactobacillus putidus]
MIVGIIMIMFMVGLLLGFVGAGGSGFIISILTTVFGFSIHTSLGTALAAMIFTSVSGSISHYKEGNMLLNAGIPVGLFGAAGAWFSSTWSAMIPAGELKWMTAGILFLSALLIWLRMMVNSGIKENQRQDILPAGFHFWLYAAIVGISSGILSGLFGIGSTPFIQLGMMFLLNFSVRRAAGTTMLVITPIALSAGINDLRLGYLDLALLLEVVAGTMSGAYIGAKFTKRLPPTALKTAMILVPVLGALLLVI